MSQNIIVKEIQVGDQNQDLIDQILTKYSLECELCFQENGIHIVQQFNQNGNREIRLIPAKVISHEIPKKSHIVVCYKHYDIIGDLIDKLTHPISYSVNQADIKKAKLIRIRNIDLLEAIQAIKNNYCCRVLKFRFANIEKQIQRLNYDNYQEIIKSASEMKKKNLELIKIKFQLYVQNLGKMNIRQKFLIYHFYKRLEAKANNIQIDNNLGLQQKDIDTISQSMSMPIPSQIMQN